MLSSSLNKTFLFLVLTFIINFSGVKKMVVLGSNVKQCEQALSLCKVFSGALFCTAGNSQFMMLKFQFLFFTDIIFMLGCR